jgi:trehalose 6-phosphate phosphatase
VLTIYVGDDQTDEDAFSVLKAAEDISVLVGDGNRASRAKYYLENVPEVGEFLLRLAELP